MLMLGQVNDGALFSVTLCKWIANIMNRAAQEKD